ncbi:hypothetical protein [Actinospica robiniae]|uniref:preprotein translocase subunit SecA n=1 Tax=Actinospica robiniae TaxID=304901 RepID=UPI0012F7E2B4|nr:hypothetical protein [Actinospica robiniae]
MRFRRKTVDIIAETAAFEAQYRALDEAGLRALTAAFRRRLADGASAESLLPEALAAAREAGWRVLGERAVDEQVLGATAMARGRLAEMKTGEGKTLAIAMAAYAWSLEGRGVHVLTANAYLARRDAEWMGPVYEALGTSCSLVARAGEDHRALYDADIVYGTCLAMCPDYINDLIQFERAEWQIRRGLPAVIVDEADLILIDAMMNRTSRWTKEESAAETKRLRSLVRAVERLVPERHLAVDRHRHLATLTADGERAVQDVLGVEDLYQGTDPDLQRLLADALCAVFAWERDQDYIVLDGKVGALDKLTGRLDGFLHLPNAVARAIEVKEGLAVSPRETVLYGMNHPHFIKRHPRVAAATGTALEERLYRDVYGLEVERVPTHSPIGRIDHPVELCGTGQVHADVAVKAVRQAFAAGRPVLVVAGSIAQSEQFADRLREHGFTPEVLNPKNHEQEAEIIGRTGRAGAVTVVTRMAGRGVDIKLGGGDPAEHAAVARAGGLYVLGLDVFENRRLELHVRGRAGRRGDPGESAIVVSLEDQQAGSPFRKLIPASTQETVSGRLVEFAVRRSLDRANEQWEQRYLYLFGVEGVEWRHLDELFAVRWSFFDGDRTRERVIGYCEALIGRHVRAVERGSASVEQMRLKLADCYPILRPAEELAASGNGLRTLLVEDITRAYERREAEVGTERMRRLERRAGMAVHDRAWQKHVTALDEVAKDVTLHSLTGSNWLTRYQQEANRALRETKRSIAQEIVELVFQYDVAGRTDL